ncbi:MAG: cytochrome c3 family protein [Desulfitobacteriaceae bacterium]
MAVLRKIKLRWTALWSTALSKRLLIIAGFLALGIVGTIKVTSLPSFCGSCHEMNPEYATWQASAHDKIACVKCHIEPGIMPLVKDKVEALNQVFEHVTKRYYLPLEIKKPIPNSVCESCHTEARTITPSGDIKIPHDKHLAQGIACVTCHSGVAHGTISERQVTIDGNFERWNSTLGRQNMVSSFRTLDMNQCLECHKERKAPQECKTCHTKIVPPPSHQTPAWVQNGVHGQEAFQSTTQCNKCHNNTLAFNAVHRSDPVTEYARSNTLCVTCHLKKPASHNVSWVAQHGNPASKNERSCLVCHESATVKKTDNAPATVCKSCHGQPHRIPTAHPIPLPKGTLPNSECYQCHQAAQCSRCHH